MKKIMMVLALGCASLNATAVTLRDGAEGTVNVTTTISTSYQPLSVTAIPKNVNKDLSGKVPQGSVLATISIQDPNGDSANASYCFFSEDVTTSGGPLELHVAGDVTKKMNAALAVSDGSGNFSGGPGISPVSELSAFRTASSATGCVPALKSGNLSLLAVNNPGPVAGGEYSTTLRVLSLAP